ncbi:MULTISPECIES: hypothetical protein [unclassified Bradyrhizobium]|uniref:hypothetical protein n=1 Tax=unclassified Bradyrhizobium TaxID=2631580 RepID=UPI0016064CB8|nr:MULTISPECIES: hypothetical protein [unclassified Bradyrhizobium]MBB4362496.1 hypothetical protein [Bradyrhizobium sp. CIR18]MBB4395743.1 hypothetical protein [Bradyrhizobium sp. ERR14]
MAATQPRRKAFIRSLLRSKRQGVYTTRLAASKLVDRTKAQAILWALEDGIDGKSIAQQAYGPKRRAIQVDFQYRKKKRKHDGNEDQEGRGFPGNGIFRPIKRAQSA